MELNKILNERYSVKKFDSEYKLSEKQLNDVKDLLVLAPSSVNIQPWHFTIATSEDAINKVAKSTVDFGFNDEKIREASALVVFSLANVDDKHLSAVIEKEEADNRYASEEFKVATDNGRRYFHNLHVEAGSEKQWLTNQLYLNAGHFVLGLSLIGIDSVIMEGFDPIVLKEELDLDGNPVLIIGIGKRSSDDYNAALPKSRLAANQLIDLI